MALLHLANTERTDPNPEMRTSITSPGVTGAIGPKAPVIIVSPAKRGMPTVTILRANQRAALSGLPTVSYTHLTLPTKA